MSSHAPPHLRVSPMLAVAFLGLVGAVQPAASNISSTALVSASRSLSMSGGTQALAASIQTMFLAATVISTGLLADRLGRRQVLVAALVTGALGSIIVAIAPMTWIYLAGQAVIGTGVGAVYGATFAYIRGVCDPKKIAAAVGVYSAVINLFTLLFTFAGGTLAAGHWRIAYFLVPVVSVIFAVLVPIVLPNEERITGTSMDLLGQFLLFAAIIVLLYGISQLGHSLTSPSTLVPIIAGVLLFAAFFVAEAHRERRFFPVSLFRSPVFVAAVLAGFVYNFGTAVSFLQVTNLWQYINGLTTTAVALWQLPLIGTGILSALVIGWLMGKGLSNRMAILIGTVLTAGGFAWLALLHSASGLMGFLPGLMLTGAGVVACAVPFGNLFIREAPPKYFGPVTSARTTSGQFFYAIGFALSTVMIDRLTVGGTIHRLDHAGVPPDQTGTALGAVTAYATRSTRPDTSLGKQALADATTSYGHAFAVTMIATAVICLVAGLAGYVLLLRDSRATDATAAAPAPAA